MQQWSGALIVALLGSLLVGCSGGGTRPESVAQPAPSGPADAQAAPASAPAPAVAAVRPLQPEQAKVTVADASLAGNDAALWTAVERGYFQEYGLDVDLLYTRTVSGIQAMLSGEVQFMATGCTEVMESRRAGSDLTLLANTNPFNLYLIAARPEITSVQELVGKRVAVNQLNDTSHLSARYAIKEGGVDPDAVLYLQVGSTPERFAALQAGAVEGALQAVTNLNEIKSLGLNVVVNLFERRVPYCGSGIAASEAYIRTNPRTTEALLRGFVKGNAYLREGDPDTLKAIMAKYMKAQPTDAQVVSAYEYFGKQINPRDPSIGPEGVAFILAQQAQSDSAWVDWKPEQFYDSAIMDKLRREGFLDAVYQQIQ